MLTWNNRNVRVLWDWSYCGSSFSSHEIDGIIENIPPPPRYFCDWNGNLKVKLKGETKKSVLIYVRQNTALSNSYRASVSRLNVILLLLFFHERMHDQKKIKQNNNACWVQPELISWDPCKNSQSNLSITSTRISLWSSKIHTGMVET